MRLTDNPVRIFFAIAIALIIAGVVGNRIVEYRDCTAAGKVYARPLFDFTYKCL